MDATAVAAVAAVGGSLLGGLTSFVTTLITQRLSARRERELNEMDRREDLYADFERLAAELMLESVEQDLTDPARMVGLMTMTGRIRLMSSEPVLEAAEAVIARIMASYSLEPRDPREALKTRTTELIEPLIRFADACRAERLALKRRL